MKKQAISIRLDNDILAWFRKEFPEGYQKGIHRVLRQYTARRQEEVSFIAGRAQQAYVQFHALCFWHLKKDLQITVDLIPMVQEGLRKFGGRQGFLLADELNLQERRDH